MAMKTDVSAKSSFWISPCFPDKFCNYSGVKLLIVDAYLTVKSLLWSQTAQFLYEFFSVHIPGCL